MKKIIRILLFMMISACIFIIPLSASEIGQTEKGLRVEYLYEDDEHTIPILDENGTQYVTVIGYIGSSGKVEIPTTVNMSDDGKDNTIRSISAKAFAENTVITHMVIPDTIVEIGEGAFSGCTNLVSVELPDSITEIPNDCFSCCTILSNITIPDTVTVIGSKAFEECMQLRNIHIPESVTEIGAYAFYACENLIIDCSDNEYAMQYAADNSLFTEFDESPDYIVVKVIIITVILGAVVFIGDYVLRRFKNKNDTKADN